jgi:cytochrome c
MRSITIKGMRRGMAASSIVLGMGLPVPAFAQVAHGDIVAGHALARQWCSSCHAVERNPAQVSDVAPSFAAIAKMPSTTTTSLRVWLQSPHPRMPNLQLTRQQIDDINSYILSLKSGGGL